MDKVRIILREKDEGVKNEERGYDQLINLALAPFHKICPPQLFIKTVELSVLESEKKGK